MMIAKVDALLAEAARALLAGRLADARASYRACEREVPHLAALGLTFTAWQQGDMTALRLAAARALALDPGGEGFPRGFVRTLEGLAMVHAGAVREGLARQSAGLAEAHRDGEGAELNASVAIAETLLYLGRWEAARATLAGIQPLVGADTPLAAAAIARLALALDVLAGHPGAEASAQALAAGARERGDDATLAWALRWQAEPAAWEEAARVAAATGQQLLAAEALAALAAVAAGNVRRERLAAAHAAARASGSAIASLAVELVTSGARAARALETWLVGMTEEEREAFLRWPGRVLPVAEIEAGTLERLGHQLATIAAQPDPAAVSRAALAAFVALVGAERGFLLRLAGFEVVDQAVWGAAPDAYSTSLAGRVMWTGEPLVVEDLEADGAWAEAASVRELGLRMAIGLPLLLDGETVGVMLADGREAHPGFGAETLALARAIAAHVVVAWQGAERSDRLEREGAVDAALARVGLAAAGAAGLDALLPAIAREAHALLGAERVFVCHGAMQAACDAEGKPLPDAQPSQGAVQWVAEHGQPLVVTDAHEEDGLAERQSIRTLALRAIHAAPIPGGGVLYCDSQVPGSQPEDGRLLTGLAAIVGAVLRR